MSKIDVDLINRRLVEIKQLLDELKDIVELGLENFLSNPYVRDAAKYKLIVAIEAAISVCNHIVVRVVKEIPSSYSDCFIILGKHKIISQDLAEKLANMAKFRNMLVHIYWKIDDKKVYEIMKKDVSDLNEFIKEVKDYVSKQRGDKEKD
ncbi:type VII toxin-antitoxin system HepT family RNase toxin [Methanocaldococcus sp.]